MKSKLYAKFLHPNNGYQYDKDKCKEQSLELNERYEVLNVSMGQSHTSIVIKNKQYSFNSVNFEFEDEDGNDWDIYSDPNFNPYLE